MVVFLQWRARPVSRSSQYRCLVASTTRMQNNLSTSALDNNASSNEHNMEFKKIIWNWSKRSEKSLWWSKCCSNIDQSYLIKCASWVIFAILASQPLCPPWPLDIIVPSDSLSPPWWGIDEYPLPNPTQTRFTTRIRPRAFFSQNIRV